MTSSYIKIAHVAFLFLAMQQASAQEVIIKIEEDYTNPHGMMWVKGDEFQERYIKDGMYISKAAKMHPRLEFDLDINQLACKYTCDMEFAIVKLKGDKESFITVELKTENKNVTYGNLQFQYNNLGDWQLGEGNTFTLIKSGKAIIKEESNLVKISNNGETIVFYINNEKIAEHKFNELMGLRWYGTRIFSTNKKFQIALDKATFIGYLDERNENVGEYELERFSSFSFLKVYGRSDVFIINDKGKKRLMDDRGRITKQAFYNIDVTYSGNWLIVSNEFKSQFGYVDSKGNEMLPVKYKKVESVLCNENHKECYAIGYYKVTDNTGEVFYINPETKELISEATAKAKYNQLKTEKLNTDLVNSVNHLQKTCNADFFDKLASGIRNDDLNAIKNVVQVLGISGYTEKLDKNMNLFNPDPRRQGENCTVFRSIEKFGTVNSPLLIEKFESGVFQVSRNMKQDEVDFTRQELKKAETNKKGWQFMGVNGLWEYWLNANVIVMFPAPNDMNIGGDCTIYKKPIK